MQLRKVTEILACVEQSGKLRRHMWAILWHEQSEIVSISQSGYHMKRKLDECGVLRLPVPHIKQSIGLARTGWGKIGGCCVHVCVIALSRLIGGLVYNIQYICTVMPKWVYAEKESYQVETYQTHDGLGWDLLRSSDHNWGAQEVTPNHDLAI